MLHGFAGFRISSAIAINRLKLKLRLKLKQSHTDDDVENENKYDAFEYYSTAIFCVTILIAA